MIKNMILTLSLLFLFLACSDSKMQNTRKGIYLENTPEYNVAVKNAKVSIKEAKTKICRAYKNKVLLNENRNFFRNDEIKFGYYFIHLDNYVFSTPFLITKHDGSTTVTNRIYININTGKLTQEHKNEMIYVKEMKWLINVFDCLNYN